MLKFIYKILLTLVALATFLILFPIAFLIELGINICVLLVQALISIVVSVENLASIISGDIWNA